MINAAQMAIVIAGLFIPTAFVLFVISVTRRGSEFGKMGPLFAAIEALHGDLHRAFAKAKERDGSNQ